MLRRSKTPLPEDIGLHPGWSCEPITSNVRFSNRALLSSSVFPVFVVITAWVILLYVVGLAIALAATSIGRNGLESLALASVANVRFGSKVDINHAPPPCPLYPRYCCKTPSASPAAQHSIPYVDSDASLLRERARLRINIASQPAKNSFATLSGVKRTL